MSCTVTRCYLYPLSLICWDSLLSFHLYHPCWIIILVTIRSVCLFVCFLVYSLLSCNNWRNPSKDIPRQFFHSILFTLDILQQFYFRFQSYLDQSQSGLYSYLEKLISSYSNWIQSPPEYDRVLFGGLLGSWFSFLQFSVSPFVGSASDVLGRKGPLISCLVGVSFAYLFWLCSSYSFTLFVISRTIAGLSKGNVSISTAVVADVSSESRRGKGMALIGMAFSLGFIVGPIMGATFSIYSKSLSSSSSFFFLPAFVSLSLSLINVLFVTIYFKESLPLDNRVSTCPLPQ